LRLLALVAGLLMGARDERKRRTLHLTAKANLEYAVVVESNGGKGPRMKIYYCWMLIEGCGQSKQTTLPLARGFASADRIRDCDWSCHLRPRHFCSRFSGVKSAGGNEYRLYVCLDYTARPPHTRLQTRPSLTVENRSLQLLLPGCPFYIMTLVIL
jgi:hypothetical protein